MGAGLVEAVFMVAVGAAAGNVSEKMQNFDTQSMCMKKSLLAIVVAAVFLGSCQPKPNTGDLLKNMVVVTDYDNTVDFTQYSSYYLPLDTLSYFNSSDTNPADTLAVDQSGTGYVGNITTRVNNNMLAAGYTKVGKKASPDLKVYVFIVENYNVYQTYNYYPYGYGYGYGFGYGYGYGGYGYGYSSYSVSDQANLYIEIFDLKNKVNGKPKLIWYSNISDLVSSPDQTATTIVLKSIDQAFKQSSYLKK